MQTTAYAAPSTAVRRGPWTRDEDTLLLQGVRACGARYAQIAREYLGGARTGAQCRERYVNSLDPAVVRAPWTPDEDARLMRAIEQRGRAYADIARGVFGGRRTDEAVRKRALWLQQSGRYSPPLAPDSDEGDAEDDDSLVVCVRL